jgi:predicted aspartyl protease
LFERPVESDRAQRKDIKKISNDTETGSYSWPVIDQKMMGCSVDGHIKKYVPSEEDVICFYYINENNVETCPQIKISIGKQQCKALIDTGCQCSVMAEELYEELKARGLDSLELPMQNVVLKSAFTGKTMRVTRQALVKLQINNTSIDQIILISPQLVTPLLLGTDFCTDNHVVINFHNNTIIINAGNKGNETHIDLVNGERKTDSKNISRVVVLKTADHQTPLCHERLPEECVEGKLYNEIYELFSGFVEDTINDDMASRASDTDEYQDVSHEIVKGNHRHSDASIIQNLSVRG